MSIRQTALAAVLAVLTPLASGAQLTQVFAPAALGSDLTVHTFETTPGGPGATYSASGGVTRADVSGSTGGSTAGGVTPSGSFALAAFGGLVSGPLTIAFDSPTRAVGLFFGNDDPCCSRGFSALLSAYNSATLIGTIGVVANLNDFVDQFIGFTSTTDVTSVQLDYDRTSAANLAVLVDDVQFAAAATAVPEPSTVALVGGGLALLAGLGRRRRV